MSHVQQFIEEVDSKLPDVCDTSDLIKLGIFSSISQAVQRRKRGSAPEFLRLSEKRIVYPKKAVISWLKERAVVTLGKVSNESNNTD